MHFKPNEIRVMPNTQMQHSVGAKENGETGSHTTRSNVERQTQQQPMSF